tara:strand:- start:468 stop:962 length:495 start_codon:yes stop_codon:yes gene_type:complete
MKKSIILLTLMFFFSGIAMAQYDYAIGLRSGGTSGITLKKNYGPSAIEGIIGFWHDGFSVTGLWEKNQMAFNEPGLNWIYGVGGHVAVYGDDFDGRGGPAWYDHPHDIGDGDLGLGIDGIFGLEYKIPDVPIAFGIDFKPYLEIVTEGTVLFSIDPGIGIKVAF